MTRSLLHRSKWMFASGLAVGLLVGVGMMVGALSARWFDSNDVAHPFAEMKLHAMATNSGDTFSMCTGPVADGMEGVFLRSAENSKFQAETVDRTGTTC